MRKGRDGEWKMEKKWKKNNGENSGPLTSLPVNRLTATDCNAAARAKNVELNKFCVKQILVPKCFIPNNFGSKKILAQKKLDQKTRGPKTSFAQKNFGPEYLDQKT